MYLEIKKFRIQYLTVAIATLIYASDGIHEGWISPAVQRILNQDTSTPLRPEDNQWISQAQILGKMLGVPLSFLFFRNCSRKLAILLSPAPLLFSWVAVVYAPSSDTLLLGKLIGGMADPMTTVCLTVYIGEVAHPDIRGVLGLGASLIYNMFILLSYIFTPLVSLKESGMVNLIFVLIQMLSMLFILESPYYLLSVDKEDEAKKNLQILSPDSKGVESELQRIATVIKQQLEQKSQFFKLFTDSTNRKALFIALLALFCQPMGGISVMTFHCHVIFSKIGSDMFSQYSSILYQTVMVLSSFISVVVVVKYNSRILLILSCLGCALSLFIQGTLFYVQEMHLATSTLIPYLLLANTLVHVMIYKCGLGGIPNILLTEVFAINVKICGCALGIFAYALSFLLMNAIFNYTKDTMGMFAPFWIFACLCLLSSWLCYMFIPNTKGKSLEEIQEDLAKTAPKC